MSNSATVLLVDDDANFREYVRDVLEMSGLTVLEAADAPAALSVAEGTPSPIDLLLTDVEMPGMDGIELAQRVRFLRPETRVRYMSGSDPHELAERGLPRRELITKPFGIDVLVNWVRHAVGATHHLGSFGRSVSDARA